MDYGACMHPTYLSFVMQNCNEVARENSSGCSFALQMDDCKKKESAKRKKEDHYSSKKSKDKKEKVSDSSSKPPVLMADRPTVPPYPLPVLPVDDDEISSKADSTMIQNNISLLCQTRDNILRILKEINDAPETMKQMPSLPVKINEDADAPATQMINEDLVNSLLPRPTVPMQ
ncbi:hypothetical protein Zm00014a_016707 [Zea mays]|uniref:Uncharacterized protein n=1 Tax=Zea mays TaxID=4577 RepID=A0A3L6GCG6_MAIZE|nr:hypothetical protein Zm00014a_016707 [Zea mays]PWZ46077.1 hypothetical protein Zm00014a_016707 [Zea mays]